MGGIGGIGRNVLLEAIRAGGRPAGGRPAVQGPAQPYGMDQPVVVGGGTAGSMGPPEKPWWFAPVDWFMDTPAGWTLKQVAKVGSSIPANISTIQENIGAAGGQGSWRGQLAGVGGALGFGAGMNPFQAAREDQESAWDKTQRLYGWAEFLEDHGPQYFEDHDWTRRVVGFIGDVAFDPLTYVTLGSGSLAIRTSAAIARELTEASLRVGAKTTLGVKLAAASSRVSKSGSKTAAGREALEHLGYGFGLGMSMPGTGRVGRFLRVDKAMDKLSGGAVTAARMNQMGSSQRVGTWLQGRFVHTPLPVPGSKVSKQTFEQWFTQAVRGGVKRGNRMIDDYADVVAPRVTSPRIDPWGTREAVRAAREAGEEVDLTMFGKSPASGAWGKDVRVHVDAAGEVAAKVDPASPLAFIVGAKEDPLASLLDLIDWSATPLGRAPFRGTIPAHLGDEPLVEMTARAVLAGGSTADVNAIRRMAASARKMRVGFQISNTGTDLIASFPAQVAGGTLSMFHKMRLGRWMTKGLDRQVSIKDLMRSTDPHAQHTGQAIKAADARAFRYSNEWGSFAEKIKRKMANLIEEHGLDPNEVRIAMEEPWEYGGVINPNLVDDAPSVVSAGREVHEELVRMFPDAKIEWERITGAKIRSEMIGEAYVTRVPSPAGRELLSEAAEELLEDVLRVPGQRVGASTARAAVTATGEGADVGVRGTASALKARDYVAGSRIWGQRLVTPGTTLWYRAADGSRRVLRRVAPSVTRQMDVLGEAMSEEGRFVSRAAGEWTPMFEKDILKVWDSYSGMMGREVHWAGIEEWLQTQGIMLTGDQMQKLARFKSIQKQVAVLRAEEAALTATARQRMHGARRGVSAAEQLTAPLSDDISGAVGPQWTRERARRLSELETGSVPIEEMTLDELLGEASGYRSVIDGLSDELISGVAAVSEKIGETAGRRVRVAKDVRNWADELMTTTAAAVEARRIVAHLKRVGNRLTQLEQIGAVERATGQQFVRGSRVARQPLLDDAGKSVGHQWATPRGDYVATKEGGRWVIRLQSHGNVHPVLGKLEGNYVVGRAANLKEADALVRKDLGRAALSREAPPTPRPGRGRRPESGLTFEQTKQAGNRFIKDRILAPQQSGLMRLSNEMRVQVLFDELEQSLEYLDEIAVMAPRRLKELGMQDETVEGLKDLVAGLRGEPMRADTPASIRSYVDEVQTVKRLEGELDLADILPYATEDGIANLKMDAELGLGEAYWKGAPEEVGFTDKYLDGLIEDTTREAAEAMARTEMASGVPLAMGKGRAAEEADMVNDMLSEAVESLRGARELLHRRGQRAAMIPQGVEEYGGRGTGGLFFPKDPDWVPRVAYTKRSPVTGEDVALPVTVSGYRGKGPTIRRDEFGVIESGKRPQYKHAKILDEAGTDAKRAAAVLSGRRPLGRGEATAYDNINLASAAILKARRLRWEAHHLTTGKGAGLMEGGLEEIQDIVASLAHRHPYAGGTVSGTEMLHSLFWEGAQQFGPNSYLLTGARLERAAGRTTVPLGTRVVSGARKTAEARGEQMLTAFEPGTKIGDELITILADLVRVGTPGEMNKYLKYTSTFINWVKAGQIARPSFFQRNFMGGVFNNFLAGVELRNTGKFIGMRRAAMREGWQDAVANFNRDAGIQGLTPVTGRRAENFRMFDRRRPNELKEEAVRLGAAKLADAGTGGFDKATMTPWSKYDMAVFSDVYEANLIGAGQAGAEVARNVRLGGAAMDRRYGGKAYLNPFRSDFVWYDTIRQRNMEIEEILRGSLAYDMLATKGMNLEDAAGQVIRYHFNYSRQAQTSFESAVRQHVVPFYVWSRNSIPLMAVEVVQQPKKFLTWFRARQNLQHGTRSDRNTPEWYGHQAGIRLPIKWKGARVFAFPDMPFMDLFDLTTEVKERGVKGLVGHAGSMVGPQWRVPAEMWAEQSFFAGLPISTKPQPLPAMLDVPGVRSVLRLMPGVHKNNKGQYMVNDNILYALSNAFPLLGQTRRLVPREVGMQDRLEASLTSWALPMALRPLTQREQRGAAMKREREAGYERRWERQLEEGY